MFRLAFVVIALLAVLAGLLIGTLNSEPATLDLLWLQLHWPLGLLVLAGLSLRVLLGIGMNWLLVGWPMRLRERNRRRSPAAQAGWQEPPDA
jgi:cytochrome b561